MRGERPRQDRRCACGCGEPVTLIFSTTGRFKGYRRYVAGHGHPHKMRDPTYAAAKRAQLSAAHDAIRKPIGSRSIRHITAGAYWVIKVKEGGRWPYEHRVIMEALIGRPLRRDEHVHHLNGNGLDNRPENLTLLSHQEHSRLTGALQRWDRSKPHRCPSCGLLHAGPTRETAAD